MRTQILILISTTILFVNFSFSQKIISKIDYLNTYKEDISKQTEIIKLLEKDTSQIILLGENHGFSEPQRIDLMFLKYLNKNKGLKYYLAELDFCEAYYFNEYLSTGNDSLLNIVFSQFYDNSSQWANMEYFNKIKQIRDFNKTLPDSSKIRFLGPDQIQSSSIMKVFLSQILGSINYSKGENQFLDTLQVLISKKNKNFKEFRDFAPQLSADMIANKAYYNKILGERFYDFDFVIQNIVSYSSSNRDSVIAQNLKRLMKINKIENEKMYGLWGYFHVFQNEISHSLPLAYWLKKDFSISTIAVLTSESYMMAPASYVPKIARKAGEPYVNTKIPNSDGIMFNTNGIKLLKKVTSENSCTLFKLNDENSPFSKGKLFTQVKRFFIRKMLAPTSKNASTIDYIQYIVLLRNSNALTPFKYNK